MILYSILIYFFIGAIAGLSTGMFGIGGGSVRIPFLNFAGLSLRSAFGINLFVIPFSSIVGALTHRKNIDYSLAGYMIFGGIIGSVIGAFLAGIFPATVLAFVFFIDTVMIIAGMNLYLIFPKTVEKIKPKAKNIVLGTLLVNILTGIRGGSGGSLFPPFVKMMKFSMRKAVATSLFVIIFTAIAASVVYWGRGDISLVPALCVLIGSVIGTRIGGKISLRTKPRWLEIGLSILVIILALLVLFKHMTW